MASKRLDSIEEQLVKLEAKARMLQEKKSALLKKEKAGERKRDARRKILLGSLLFKKMNDDETYAAKIRSDLDTFLERATDRELFALPVRDGDVADA